jgi:CHASE2 domain-containing sensor protein/tRNA A-37 threonylcarbamoyl transferase component Bud32
VRIKHFDKIIGLGITLGLLLGMNSEPVRSLEWLGYGFGQTVTSSRMPNENISVIAIDDASLKALGNWPWSHEQLAAMVRYLRKTGARVIGITVDGLDVPQNELGLKLLREFRAENPLQSSSADSLLDRIAQQLNTDQSLAKELAANRNIFLSVPFTPVRRQPESLPPLPPSLEQQVIDVPDNAADLYSGLPEWLHPEPSIYADQLRAPVPVIARSVDGLGLSAGSPVVDGSTGGRPLLVRYGNQYLPSFPLLIAAAYTGQLKKIQPSYGSGIKLGEGRSIPTDNRFRALPFYYPTKKDASAFPVFSFHEVLNGDEHPGQFTGKIILLGPTSPQVVELQATPIGQKMPPVLIEAHTVSSLLNGDMYSVPGWAHWVRYATFMMIAIYLTYFLPRLGIGSGLAVTGLLLVIILNAQIILMFQTLWLPLAAPAAALVLGHLLLATKQLLLNRVSESQHELAKSNRLLAQSYHAQGQFDLAFEKYRLSTIDEELLSMTYNLGLDYERKRQFNKAVNVFRFIRNHQPNYRDTKDRVYKNLKTSNEVVLGSSRDGMEKTLVLTQGGVQKPMLGRYQIESELGKGAMGTVYLGKDPKIGRTVAIKTMPLSSEFENEMLEEVKKRFFREAETAGRLSHPNIVTIYDVGEEHDLAYIAMDFLQGTDMSKFSKKEKLLELSEVFTVIVQVADALNYAHGQNVVHRDIKPANIIYDKRTKKPTVTDFGVAHITDNTKTKTGTILGTPSFMSPEQLSGTTVDGRSDLFALGVTFFQLLTGELPFVAESISSLMYKITNEEPRDILQLRPELPICIKAIITKSLQKDAGKRYQTGEELIKALKRCEKNIEGK